MSSAGYLLSDLAKRFGLTLHLPSGGQDVAVQGINTLDAAGPQELSFLANAKYASLLKDTKAAAVITDAASAGQSPVAVLVGDNPYLAVARIAALFAQPQGCQESGVSSLAFVHPAAQVDPSATLYPFAFIGAGARVDAGARIFPHCYVGEGARIGQGATLYPGVVVMAGAQVGRGVIMHPGSVLGGDGFGYAVGPEGLVKVPQMGGAVLEDGVELGCNSTVDRGSMGETRIRAQAKIDNLVMVAHNVQVGQGSILVAQTGISGSTRIGRGVQIGGQAGVTGHISIGDGARIAAQSGVMQDVPAGAELIGSPAMGAKQFFRNVVETRRLADTAKRLRALEKELATLRAEIQAGPGGKGAAHDE